MDKKLLLSKLPKVDETLNDQRLFDFLGKYPRNEIREAIREVIDEERERILNNEGRVEVLKEDEYFNNVRLRIEEKNKYSLIKVINGTGVILHTNLGRAGLSKIACNNIKSIAEGYSTLEYDIKKGARGSRHSHVEKLITKITGAEAAMVVNNNAAATMLCLSSMAEGKEVIVSRGELVEIGGSFRVPDIMSRSGAILREVGTTNKTRIEDYENALSEETAALMKVHTSNYRIVGFTAETGLDELVELGKKNGLPVIYDMGSGLMVDLSKWGIDEPTVQQSVQTGIDVILFSGDKLLGGPQAGIIAGKKELIAKMKAHPLARVVRIDKMTLAALESTFREYLDPEKVFERIPVLKMITADKEKMIQKGMKLVNALHNSSMFKTEIVTAEEQVGGGSAPMSTLQGTAVKLKCDIPAEKLERALRKNDIPIIVRIIKNEVYIDMRTVYDDEIVIITDALQKIEATHEKRHI